MIAFTLLILFYFLLSYEENMFYFLLTYEIIYLFYLDTHFFLFWFVFFLLFLLSFSPMTLVGTGGREQVCGASLPTNLNHHTSSVHQGGENMMKNIVG